MTSAPSSLCRTTAFTPAAFSASEKSIAAMRACGCGERTILPQSMPGRAMSKVYFARPVTLSGPSVRGTDVASSDGVSGHAYFFRSAGSTPPAARLPPCCSATGHHLCRHRGFDNADECAAATDVAVQPLAHLRLGRPRVFLEQRHCGHHESRCAEAAHQRVAIDEGLLNRMQRVAVCEAIHGADLLALGFDGERRA